MVMAGVEGIRHKIDPGPPITGNVSTQDVAIPRSIWEAVRFLEKPSTFTTQLGQDLITAYRGILLRTAERFETHVSDWEIAEYRHIL
jgi:glutamine synthetase